MFSKACPFDILNIKPEADDAEIKTAYKKAVLKYHPDKSGTTDTEKPFRLVQASYELLNDRITYDKFLKACKIELGINFKSAPAGSTGGLAKPNMWANADEQLYYWEEQRKFQERMKERYERWQRMQEESPRERAKREREEKRQQDKIQKGMVQVWILGKDRRMKQKWVTKEEAAKY